MGKLSPRLADALTRRDVANAGHVDVVVQLTGAAVPEPHVTPRARRDAMRAQFDRASEPVRSVMEAAGGRVLGETWLNQSVRALVPVSCLGELASLDEVVLVDFPSEITPE